MKARSLMTLVFHKKPQILLMQKNKLVFRLLIRTLKKLQILNHLK